MLDVVIGHGSSDDIWRRRARAYVADWWLRNDYRVHFGECAGPWSKGRAVNAAAKATTSDVLILADADSLPTDDGLTLALKQVEAHGWAMPHSTVRRLDKASTVDLIAGQPGRRRLERPAYPALPGGGIVLLTRDAFNTLGGFDPRFVGWGGEDSAFGMAARTLLGPIAERRSAPLTHLWHPPAANNRRPSQGNRDLHERYRAARGHVDAMAEIVEEFSGGDT